ncbi:DUF1636 family protein [Denitromonas iodatirespirans]|uniref:DUF1636 domain-containing protein n=1 Tax=Denitromonas iodatirespirans TaxID=2795389 RepID=A0A944HCC4_DENI1|nr:DUF1636 domain-containing protein [Denitromonas iodatirespirans]MBT0962572.1 DUF1636 domain-containing protein [Denitromonas iodatirespirans]
MTPTLTVCATCGNDPARPEAIRPGERLARSLEAALAECGDSLLRLERTACLMACQRRCTALLRAPGKIGYVIGDLQPDAASVQALLDYIAGYRLSTDGLVPYKAWPDGIKGHFIARIPPLNGD